MTGTDNGSYRYSVDINTKRRIDGRIVLYIYKNSVTYNVFECCCGGIDMLALRSSVSNLFTFRWLGWLDDASNCACRFSWFRARKILHFVWQFCSQNAIARGNVTKNHGESLHLRYRNCDTNCEIMRLRNQHFCVIYACNSSLNAYVRIRKNL